MVITLCSVLIIISDRYNFAVCPDIPRSLSCSEDAQDMCISHASCVTSEYCCFTGCVMECLDIGKF